MDPKKRFSRRVKDYVKYRPYYPLAVLDLLVTEAGLTPSAIIADIGSGTGNLARLFLENGNVVYGVEPNESMRRAGEEQLATFPNFRSVDGSAEATTLPDRFVDFVVAGQAFHWFDTASAKLEFLRVLKAEGVVVLVWNDRDSGSTPLQRALAKTMQTYSPDYGQVRHARVSDQEFIERFFGEGRFTECHFDNFQDFDYSGFRGRLLSSSYSPLPGQASYRPFVADLHRIFDRFQKGGRVRLEYDTTVYYGRLECPSAD